VGARYSSEVRAEGGSVARAAQASLGSPDPWDRSPAHPAYPGSGCSGGEGAGTSGAPGGGWIGGGFGFSVTATVSSSDPLCPIIAAHALPAGASPRHRTPAHRPARSSAPPHPPNRPKAQPPPPRLGQNDELSTSTSKCTSILKRRGLFSQSAAMASVRHYAMLEQQ